MKKITAIGFLLIFLIACKHEQVSDAYGNFEAIEIMASSEGMGKLIQFNLNEGDQLKEREYIGVIDTINLYYKKQQLAATKASVSSKISNILSQIEVHEERLNTLRKDQKRITELFKTGSATQKQLDDINGNINVVNKQIELIETQNSAVLNQIRSLEWNIKIIEDQISKCKITSPVTGTVLEKYVEENELVTIGKPLYKIANLEELELRVYIPGAMLSNLKIGQKVKVLYDKNKNHYNETSGIVSWVSSQYEFTPKMIETKEERVKFIYAVKIRVKNDGSIKIGMPGEIIL